MATFVYRDPAGWPASLPYIQKIRVSMAIHTQSGIRLHERVPMVKIMGSKHGGPQKMAKIGLQESHYNCKSPFSLFFILLLMLSLLLLFFSFNHRKSKTVQSQEMKLCTLIEIHNDHCNAVLKFWYKMQFL